MCMKTVERCEILPETHASKVFHVEQWSRLEPRIRFPYKDCEGDLPTGIWLQANPIRIAYLDRSPVDSITTEYYITGFHTLENMAARRTYGG